MSLYTPIAKILFSYYLTHISRFYSGLKGCFLCFCQSGLHFKFFVHVVEKERRSTSSYQTF